MARLHTLPLKSFNQPGQFAQREPVHRRGPVLLNFRNRLFPDGGDNHFKALGAGGVQHQQGKSSISGDETDSLRHD